MWFSVYKKYLIKLAVSVKKALQRYFFGDEEFQKNTCRYYTVTIVLMKHIVKKKHKILSTQNIEDVIQISSGNAENSIGLLVLCNNRFQRC